MAPGISDGILAGGGVSLTTIAAFALFNVVRDYFRNRNSNGNGKGKEEVNIALVKATVEDTKAIVVELAKGQATTNGHLQAQTEIMRQTHAELKRNNELRS